MSDELNDLALRVGRTALALHKAISEFEHELADATTIESVDLVRQTIGGCYTAFDRVNAAANARYARLAVERDLAELRR